MYPQPTSMFKPNSQTCRIYTRLLEGPAENFELMDMKPRIPKYTGRISEVRAALRPHAVDVQAIPHGDDPSRFTYRLAGIHS